MTKDQELKLKALKESKSWLFDWISKVWKSDVSGVKIEVERLSALIMRNSEKKEIRVAVDALTAKVVAQEVEAKTRGIKDEEQKAKIVSEVSKQCQVVVRDYLENFVKLLQRFEFPSEINVKNLPSEFILKQPDWWKEPDNSELAKTMEKISDAIVKQTDLSFFTRPENALATYLVNSRGQRIDLPLFMGGGRGGGSTSAGAATDVSALATEVTLALIKAKTDNIPAKGQALDSASTPVVLTAAQLNALTPYVPTSGLSTEATLLAIKDTAGIKKITNALPAGTNLIGKVGIDQTTPGTTNGVVPAGNVAHDDVDSGNPVKVGGRAIALTSTATMVAAADRSDILTDLDGAIITRNGVPIGDILSEQVTNTNGTSTVFTALGATASIRNYCTAYSVYNSSATAGYLDIRDGSAGAILWTIPLPAGGGANLGNGTAPLFKGTTAGTALAFDVSAALSTVHISISGFKSKL